MIHLHHDADAPFLVETVHEPDDKGGQVPRSRLVVRPTLRAGGFLAAIPPEELKTLMFLLTFLTANGHFMAGEQQVATAMGASTRKAKERLERLAAYSWQGHPVATRIRRESGLDTYTPTPAIIAVSVEAPPQPDAGPPIVAAGREAVIAESRRKYSKTREEVELDIAMRSGWELPDGVALPNGEEGRKYLSARLSKIGVSDNEARILFGAYAPERIFRQTQWLRYRKAKAPAKYLIAAIEGDYDEPFALREPASPVVLEAGKDVA
ncbi:MAG TPA: hypothetical protein VGK19_04490 [Capsulimonadaceae bacterium]|jgi:hypothetical protein